MQRWVTTTRNWYQLHQFSRWPPRIASVVLVMLIGWVIWNGIANWRASKSRAVDASPALMAKAAARHTETSAAHRLIAAHLFGKAVTQVAFSVAPSQDWQVIGVVAASDPKTSVADISINGSEHLWHVGDRLPDGSMVKAIVPTGVTVGRDGHLQLMPFALRPAADDEHFATLAFTETASGTAIIAMRSPTAAKVRNPPALNSLASLRAAALRVWAARVHPKVPEK